MEFKEIVSKKSDSELLEMVYELDKWSPEMLKQIKSELSKRNILPLDIEAHNQKLIQQENQELIVGKEASMLGLIIGWICVFGLVGIFIGYTYANGKIKSKYSDEQFYKYNDASRKKGKVLFNSSIILTILLIFYKLLSNV